MRKFLIAVAVFGVAFGLGTVVSDALMTEISGSRQDRIIRELVTGHNELVSGAVFPASVTVTGEVTATTGFTSGTATGADVTYTNLGPTAAITNVIVVVGGIIDSSTNIGP